MRDQKEHPAGDGRAGQHSEHMQMLCDVRHRKVKSSDCLSLHSRPAESQRFCLLSSSKKQCSKCRVRLYETVREFLIKQYREQMCKDVAHIWSGTNAIHTRTIASDINMCTTKPFKDLNLLHPHKQQHIILEHNLWELKSKHFLLSTPISPLKLIHKFIRFFHYLRTDKKIRHFHSYQILKSACPQVAQKFLHLCTIWP